MFRTHFRMRRMAAIAVAAALMLPVTVTLAESSQAAQSHAGHDHGPAAPVKPGPKVMKGHTGPLPPLPYESYPAPRPMPVVQAAYEFAARHPEVLNFIPCYCGCERGGHAANHDCFVRSRDANGRVQWDSHGYGCAICIDVARDAMQMHNSGASPTQIRAAIDAKYGARYPSQTPTPKPPAKK